MIDVEELERLWQSGETGPRLAKRYGVHYSQIYRMAKRYGLRVTMKNGSREPPAPSPEDEQASGAGLDLAPWVARRVAALRAAWAIGDESLESV
jgi:transposase